MDGRWEGERGTRDVRREARHRSAAAVDGVQAMVAINGGVEAYLRRIGRGV